jgi:N6-adenosine-specific RNA methylase IME4
VLIDPPYPYDQKLTGKKTRGGAERHYETLAIEEIASLPVPDILAEDAMVWLWTTNAHVHHAFHLLEAWDLTYKVMGTWTKRRFGLGYWLRGKTEHLLLAVRGNPRAGYNGPHGAMGSPWSTLIEEPAPDDAFLVTGKWRGHSVKPRSSYEMIEAIAPKPRLELFARRRREGWEAWGDELDG